MEVFERRKKIKKIFFKKKRKLTVWSSKFAIATVPKAWMLEERTVVSGSPPKVASAGNTFVTISSEFNIDI